jgi:hypothetical protein
LTGGEAGNFSVAPQFEENSTEFSRVPNIPSRSTSKAFVNPQGALFADLDRRPDRLQGGSRNNWVQIMQLKLHERQLNAHSVSPQAIDGLSRNAATE